MELLWFILAAFGLTQILIYGKIFDAWRPEKHSYNGLGEIFHCSMCMGFWVGVFLFCINGMTELFSFDYTVANLLICGCVSSATSYVLCALFDDNGFKKTVNIIRDQK